jgi:hypothetical protein
MQFERFRLALLAGTGSACFLIIYQAGVDFFGKNLPYQAKTFLVWGLVLIFIMVFLGPFIERLRQVLGIPSEHHEVPQVKSLHRIVAFFIVLLVGILHGVLHDAIRENTWYIIGQIIISLILPGGITYCWTIGVGHRYLKAKWLGMLGGIGLFAIPMFFVLCWPDLARVCLPNEGILIIVCLMWSLLGFLGGLAIDGNWGWRLSLMVPLIIIGGMVLVEILLKSFYDPGMSFIVFFQGISQVVGWGVGLMLDPRTDEVLAASQR